MVYIVSNIVGCFYFSHCHGLIMTTSTIKTRKTEGKKDIRIYNIIQKKKHIDDCFLAIYFFNVNPIIINIH